MCGTGCPESYVYYCINRCAIYYLNVLWMQLDDWSQNNNWTFLSFFLFFHFFNTCLLSFYSFYPSVCFPLFYFSEFHIICVLSFKVIESKFEKKESTNEKKEEEIMMYVFNLTHLSFRHHCLYIVFIVDWLIDWLYSCRKFSN